ncbi:MAG: hypothetical protein IT577_07430 [Verrucomicrobiae bacterium]|nr:hypothetical protein [Verrucomicrobiae bacterium]
MNLSCQTFPARIVLGHRVASGQNDNPLFPGGTLKMQAPHFRALGLDLNAYHGGTLNVSIAPLRYRVVAPRLTLRSVKWHPTEPAEDFSFFDVRLLRDGAPPVEGLIYYPHPDTKPTHFQKPDVLELLLPFVSGLSYGAEIRLEVPAEQMLVEASSTPRNLRRARR